MIQEYETNVRPYISDIVKWRHDGLTLRQIGTRLGYTGANNFARFYSFSRTHPELNQAFKEKKELTYKPIPYDARDLDNYLMLSAGIIRQAQKDYTNVLFNQMNHHTEIVLDANYNYQSVEYLISQLEQFFESGWFRLLTLGALDPDRLIADSKEDAEFMYTLQEELKRLDDARIADIIKMCNEELQRRHPPKKHATNNNQNAKSV